VNAFLDSSVLVPVFLADHEHHPRSLALFLKFDKRQVSCAAHSLAEIYSTVTRLPGKFRVSAAQAMLFLKEVRDRLTLVALDEVEYYNAIEWASAQGVAGGTVYDALLAACATKVRAKTLYTWNVKHFQQFDLASRIRNP
jgi:predicted nucleic acid-binding protein